ncbi:hypothetical protein CBR_g34005 [Chara braunii]|uniref:Seipin n=1 Tax=Chara braunii TaxID=69332 RepID=A0A388LHM5_CHABU|nr:hypothetical protein CBR_g34005 [Chara braunii]|eukprot:GBG81824.1 hypothetical protein CBR_g34005 [Chara braunii]
MNCEGMMTVGTLFRPGLLLRSAISNNGLSSKNARRDGREVSREVPSPCRQQHKPGRVTCLTVKVTRAILVWSLTWILFITLVVSSLPVYLFLVWQFVPSVVKTTQPLYFDYRLQSPTATVLLLPPDKLGASQVANSPTHGPRFIPAGQKVNVWVNLKLPDSYTNRGIGVFQVTVELLSSNDNALARSTQPCIMPFQSLPVRLVRGALLIMPLIWGLVDDDQEIKLHVIRGYVERKVPVTVIRVMLDARAGMPLKSGLPEVYAADVIVDTTPRGFLAFVHRWRITSFVWGAFGLLFIEIIVLLHCCRWVVPKIRSKHTATEQSTAPTARVVAESQQRPSSTQSMYERLSSDSEESSEEDVLGQEDSSQSELEYDGELANFLLLERQLLHSRYSGEREQTHPRQDTSLDDRVEVGLNDHEEEGTGEGVGDDDDDNAEEEEEDEVALEGKRWMKMRRSSSLRRTEPWVTGLTTASKKNSVAATNDLSDDGCETQQVIFYQFPDDRQMMDNALGCLSQGIPPGVTEGAGNDSCTVLSGSEASHSGGSDPYGIGARADPSALDKGKGVASNGTVNIQHMDEE